jgi:hypothetical protein
MQLSKHTALPWLVNPSLTWAEQDPKILFGPATELPLHFADVHGDFTPYRLPLLQKDQQTVALRHMAGFPDLRLLWRHRRSPCFTAGLSAPFRGKPLTFMTVDYYVAGTVAVTT